VLFFDASRINASQCMVLIRAGSRLASCNE